MKVVVLGAGVIGICVAYELACDGHQVIVVDRQKGPALETSFGNAGEISPGDASPWAAPGVPRQVLSWLTMAHSPVVVRPRLDPGMWLWIAAMLRNCTRRRYALNRGRMTSLAAYSRDRLAHLRAATGIAYDERMLGTLQICRTPKQLDGIGRDIRMLEDHGVPFEVLDRDGVVRAEPGLATSRGKFVGGLRLPADETGDCFKFTSRLAEMAAALGVQFRYGSRIDRIATDGGRVTAVMTKRGPVSADAYVAALGSYTPLLLRPLGLRVPVYPVKGYSLTVPITDAAGAPESTVLDETYKVAVTRLGDRIRVGGTAELAGWDLALRDSRRAALEHVVTDLFPHGGDVSQASFWCGLRPMTPHGAPLLGATKLGNLYLATGHGTLGWTMGAGTGRVMADLIGGREPEVEVDGFSPRRYGG